MSSTNRLTNINATPYSVGWLLLTLDDTSFCNLAKANANFKQARVEYERKVSAASKRSSVITNRAEDAVPVKTIIFKLPPRNPAPFALDPLLQTPSRELVGGTPHEQVHKLEMGLSIRDKEWCFAARRPTVHSQVLFCLSLFCAASFFLSHVKPTRLRGRRTSSRSSRHRQARSTWVMNGLKRGNCQQSKIEPRQGG